MTADATKAAKDAAEAAAAAGGSSGGGGVSTSAADTIAKAMKKTKKAKLHEECTFLCCITYPAWPAFYLSMQFNECDPVYADGHVCVLAWRKMWQAIKEACDCYHARAGH